MFQMEERNIMTIRQAINKYNMAKANYLDKDLLYVIFNTSTCLIITMNNGVKIFWIFIQKWII